MLGIVARGDWLSFEFKECQSILRYFFQRFHRRATAFDATRLEDLVFRLLERIEHVERAGRCKSERCGGFAERPHIGQPVQRILALLQAKFIPQRAGRDLLSTAKTSALVSNHWFNRAQQLRGCHDGDRHASPLEYSLDHVAVIEVWNDRAVLDGVAANDAASGDLQ